MSNAVLKGNASGTGTVTLETPNTNTDRTITLPDSNGTVMVSGNMPAFRATNSSNQSFSGSTFTKVTFQTKIFDTASCFDNTTNYRFTPNVAGYYNVSLTLYHNYSVTSGGAIATLIYKNGSVDTVSSLRNGSNTGPWGGLNANSIIYLNGTTDYIEGYVWSNNGNPTVDTSGSLGTTAFAASLVRAA